MYGYCGKLLGVDLTAGKISIMPLEMELAEKYIGGSGLAAAIFIRLLGKECGSIDPVGPENPLIFMTGPLTGSPLPCSGRMVACARSPLTGIWGESNAGGFFGAELKKAGFDGIIITGKSPEPVMLHIEDGRAGLQAAGDLWGKDSYEACKALKHRGKVLAVGQAGENGVAYAGIVHDRRHIFGRTGMGAVMGSKLLKAVTAKGTGRVTPGRPEDVAALRRRLGEKLKESYIIQALSAQGTACNVDVGMMLGDVPIKNWQWGQWDGVEKINGTAFEESLQVGRATCFACPVGCKRESRVDGGPYSMETGPGPEYETVASFGAMCLIDSPEAIARLNDLCNRYGMDTISCGATLAFAIQCFESGRLTIIDTGGVELRWSDPGTLIELVKQIGTGAGFGKLLGRGSGALAEKLGPESRKYLTTVKKLESPMHDPRAGHGLGLGYATSVRGACHVSSLTMHVEQGASIYPMLGLGEEAYNGQTSEGKAEMVKKTQDLGMVFGGAAIFCLLGGMVFDDADLVDAMKSVTGGDWTLDRLMECGERIWCLKRAIGNLCGITAPDDMLPEPIMTPLEEGSSAGSVPDMEMMLREYYQMRGLDDSGRVLPEKLRQLGLEEVSNYFENILHKNTESRSLTAGF
ncbi:MAG: aldehyde ferredoxin oxidoreductase family protein [Bacillota bacterium]